MKLKHLGLFAFLIYNLSFSQSKTAELTSKKDLIDYGFYKDGGCYFLFGKVSVPISPLKKNVLSFNSNLEKLDDIDLSDIISTIKVYTSPSKKIPGFERIETTTFSERNRYFFGEKEYNIIKGKANRGSLKEVINTFHTDQYQITFGSTEKMKDKDIYQGHAFSDLFLYKTDFKTLESKLINIQFPTNSFTNGSLYYQYLSHDNNKVFFLLNDLDKNDTKNNCVLVSFDYDGNLIDNIAYTIDFENKSSFDDRTNKNDDTTVTILNGQKLVDMSLESATAKVFLSPDQKSFYAYGIFATIPSGVNKWGVKQDQNPQGFYIYKYDLKGTLLWKMEKKTTVPKNNRKTWLTSDSPNLVALPNNTIGFWCEEFWTDNTHYFMINGASGEVTQQKTIKKEGSVNFKRVRNVGLDKSQFYLKNSKIRINDGTIFAANFNPAVEKFLSTKENAKFFSYVCENGIYMIEENITGDNFKLHKFDW